MTCIPTTRRSGRAGTSGTAARFLERSRVPDLDTAGPARPPARWACSPSSWYGIEGSEKDSSFRVSEREGGIGGVRKREARGGGEDEMRFLI